MSFSKTGLNRRRGNSSTNNTSAIVLDAQGGLVNNNAGVGIRHDNTLSLSMDGLRSNPPLRNIVIYKFRFSTAFTIDIGAIFRTGDSDGNSFQAYTALRSGVITDLCILKTERANDNIPTVNFSLSIIINRSRVTDENGAFRTFLTETNQYVTYHRNLDIPLNEGDTLRLRNNFQRNSKSITVLIAQRINEE